MSFDDKPLLLACLRANSLKDALPLLLNYTPGERAALLEQCETYHTQSFAALEELHQQASINRRLPQPVLDRLLIDFKAGVLRILFELREAVQCIVALRGEP